MTVGLPTTIKVELEDGSGNFTNDISGFARLNEGWSIKRGWADENQDDDVQPTVLALRLDDPDGRFVLGSAFYNGITKDKRIRVSWTVGVITYRRFVGYVPDWPTEWESAIGNYAVVYISAVDRLARLNRRGLRSIAEHEVLADQPVYLYTLDEDSGATSAGDTSGNGGNPLVLAGTGTAPAFGAAVAGAIDPAVTGAQYAGGQYLVGATPSAQSWEIAFVRSGPPAQMEALLSTLGLLINTDGTLWADGTIVAGSLVGGIATGSSCCDGTLQHAVVTHDGATVRLYSNGALVGTLGDGIPPIGRNPFVVGGGLGLGPVTTSATVLMVAGYAGVLTSTRVAAHAAALRGSFPTDRADQRIARLAGYANIAPADQNLETGQQPSIAAQATSGVKALEAMREVVKAEGGGLFVSGDGKLTMHNKSHRVLKATGTPAVTITLDDIVPSSIRFASDNYLFNTATGSRTGGATQRSENAASRLKYEEWPTDRSKALLPSDDLLLNALTWITNMYAEPRPRLSSFTVNLATHPTLATVQAILALELGDLIRVTGFPAQAPASSLDLIYEGSTETIQRSPKGGGSWQITFNTAPAPLFYAWILGDSTYGQLDVTTRLYF